MKNSVLLIGLFLFHVSLYGQFVGNANAGSGSGELKSGIDSASYSIGLDIGRTIKQSGCDSLNVSALVEGLVLVLNNDTAKTKIKVDKVNIIISEYIQKVKLARDEKNKKESEGFLALNLNTPGIRTTKSGVQYLILKKGKGAIPCKTAKVKVLYSLVLINGEEIENGFRTNIPTVIEIKDVIKGWQEILQIMPIGSKWKVFIPQELAYGDIVGTGKIKPYMALIFEIELLEIISQKTELDDYIEED
jgi:FKBP-type peptidyl-prolyl cis-trans isomerase FklB